VPKQSQKGWKSWGIIGLLIALLSLFLLIKKAKANNPLQSLDLIQSTDYKHLAPFIIAQAKHETTFKGIPFNSPVFRYDNNIFGMKEAGSRVQVGSPLGRMSPEGNRYWHFPNTDESVKDFILYLQKTKFPKQVLTVESYVSELKKRGYFTAPESEYLNGLKRFL